MNADAGMGSGVIRARLDGQDRICSADDLLLRLQRAAGGDPDGCIAVPQIAAVARLARRLGILIARPLLIGGQERDIRLWVRAKPLGDHVEMDFSDWQESLHADGEEQAALRAAQIALAPDGWEWRTDAQMRFLQVGAGSGSIASGDEFFATFTEDGGTGHRLATEIAVRRSFFGLAVRLKDGGTVQLSGYPLFDNDGSFLGYRGKASPAGAGEGERSAAPVDDGPVAADIIGPDGLPDFGRRLDLALRQPLGRIIANAETIKAQMEGPLRTDYTAYAADIADAGRHLMELVDDLADLQAIDRARFEVASEDIDLADLGRRAAGLLGVKAADRNIRVEPPDYDEKVPAIGEFRRALQIIVNLLNNAIRYSPENSIIWVRAGVEGREARLVVADQGRGIAPEDQERVFEKFERLGRQDAAGSGLGLYISRKLARAMRGDLTVESAPGQGARFILTLPVGEVEPDIHS
ncbi:MAG: sensor histidine kinase [Sphingobium sp.]